MCGPSDVMRSQTDSALLHQICVSVLQVTVEQAWGEAAKGQEEGGESPPN